ncbi:MAG: hypothetical protein MK110_00740 [Fuerstiella sp.]|nr:hypothetical protein [Fuerstiella sp.]
MNQDPVRVNQVHWTRVFPFLRLFKAATLGCRLSAILIAGVAVQVSWNGSNVICYAMTGSVVDFPTITGPSVTPATISILQNVPAQLLPRLTDNVLAFASDCFLMPPSRDAFLSCRLITGSQGYWPAFVLMVWNALNLGFFGTALARLVSTQFCCQSRTGIFASVCYAARHWKETLLAAGLIITILLILRSLLVLAGYVSGFGFAGQTTVSVLWILIELTGVGLVLGFLVGGAAWLLSPAATGVDGCSGAESVSRCISYCLSHPLLLLIGLATITALAFTVRKLCEALLIAGSTALPPALKAQDPDDVRQIGMYVMAQIPEAVHLAVFLAGTTILYILLRQREDGISTDEIDGAVSPRRTT